MCVCENRWDCEQHILTTTAKAAVAAAVTSTATMTTITIPTESTHAHTHTQSKWKKERKKKKKTRKQRLSFWFATVLLWCYVTSSVLFFPLISFSFDSHLVAITCCLRVYLTNNIFSFFFIFSCLFALLCSVDSVWWWWCTIAFGVVRREKHSFSCGSTIFLAPERKRNSISSGFLWRLRR